MARGMVSMHFEGGKELEAALRQLPLAVARNATIKAMKDVTAPLAEDMVRAAPRLTGEGAESIRAGAVSVEGQDLTVAVGPSRQAELESGLSFAEFGTAKQPAEPWLRPVWDQHKERVLRDLGAAWWDRILKAARRYAKKVGA